MNKDERLFRGIFRRGSRTYFNSSRFFPRRIRGDITCLYSFVRTADEFVDAVPQDPAGFAAFRRIYLAGRVNGRDSGNPIIDRFLELSRRHSFRLDWVEAFLDSMAMDLTKKDYLDLGETLMYMYGSAEVIGLMMSRIMGLDERAFPYARLLGRAMQYINFIRDIQEDLDLGRTYLPQNELRAAGLESLSEQAACGRPDAFRSYLLRQISRSRAWQAAAGKGYAFLPRRCRIAVRTAADMHAWTVRRIESDPFVVFRTKVKPSRARIVQTGLINFFDIKGN
jgi:phytoene synthase